MEAASRFLFSPFALGLAAGLLLAQDYRARVQGVVTDSSQALVVGATVTLRNS